MDADCYTFIFSLIFSFFLIFAGILFRRIKYGIPFKESLHMLWQEGIVDNFKEFRANFIPVTTKAIGWIWEYITEKIPRIVKFFRSDPEPVKHTFICDLECGLQAAAAEYTYK